MSVVAPTRLDFGRIVLKLYFLFLWFYNQNQGFRWYWDLRYGSGRQNKLNKMTCFYQEVKTGGARGSVWDRPVFAKKTFLIDIIFPIGWISVMMGSMPESYSWRVARKSQMGQFSSRSSSANVEICSSKCSGIISWFSEWLWRTGWSDGIPTAINKAENKGSKLKEILFVTFLSIVWWGILKLLECCNCQNQILLFITR